MSTRIDPGLLQDLRAFGLNEASRCWHCSNCTATCPLSTAIPVTLVWARTVAPRERTPATKARVSPDGSTVYVTGSSVGAYMTIAYSTVTGSMRWLRRYNAPGEHTDRAGDIVVSPDGTTVFVTGYSWDSIYDIDAITTAYDAAAVLQREIGARLGRIESLDTSDRVEFGGGVSKELVLGFAGSPFVSQATFVETLLELQDLFYSFGIAHPGMVRLQFESFLKLDECVIVFSIIGIHDPEPILAIRVIGIEPGIFLEKFGGFVVAFFLHIEGDQAVSGFFVSWVESQDLA